VACRRMCSCWRGRRRRRLWLPARCAAAPSDRAGCRWRGSRCSATSRRARGRGATRTAVYTRPCTTAPVHVAGPGARRRRRRTKALGVRGSAVPAARSASLLARRPACTWPPAWTRHTLPCTPRTGAGQPSGQRPRRHGEGWSLWRPTRSYMATPRPVTWRVCSAC